ncbi:hypothetical protein [Sulfurimonas microaerophilic]|uniref:hypothetical protein n=1 Tax=Sulfurimonas microaerophilic TaxID=3058392 RepID=UPI0027153EC1|nr:hypothetical protein [Sulfurimonas sp. hsl 1-7]
MRSLVLFLLIITALVAKDKETCYSVQLLSYIPQENSYEFEADKYPNTCKLFEFSHVNAVRCGCFEKYGEAKKEHKAFQKKYKQSMIVTTYKYRFAPKKSIAVVEEKQETEIELNATKEDEDQELLELEEGSFLEDVTFQGHVNLAAQTYISHPSGKHANNYTASAELEAAYNKESFKAFMKLRGQQDYYDLKASAAHNDRSYLRVKELYGTYDFENSQLFFGKNIRFWGALEVKNITDVFNLRDFRSDPTENDKMGSWNMAYTYYSDDAEISAIVKFYEENRKMPAYPYVYYPFTNQLITYESDLQTTKSQNSPSIYLKYSGSGDGEYALDYSIIFEHGYDSQRFYNVPVAPEYKVYENAYYVNKFITYNTLVVDSTLYKLEAVYADVLDQELISDYYHLGLGVEHTFTQVYKEADLGVLAEYYRYGALQSDIYTDIELFEVFQNDLFIGARYSFNEGNDASIVGGAIFDLEYDEQVYYIKYESRINDIFKLHLDYRQSEPSDTYETALKRMGKQKRMSVKAGYYF